MTKKAEVIYRLRLIRAHVNKLLTDLEGAKADPNGPAYETAADMLTDCETRVAMLGQRVRDHQI